MQRTNLKIEKKNDQKQCILGTRYKRMAIKLKCQDLELLFNLHTKFQLSSSIWTDVMRGTNPKNEKTRPKNYNFRAVSGCNEAETLKPFQKTHLRPYIPNLNFLGQFGEELCQKKSQKRRKPNQETIFLGL